MYMNFMDVSATLDSANSSTLVEEEVATGLSIRGGLAFLIHKVEIIPADIRGTVAEQTLVALSTKAGLTTIPELGDSGCILKYEDTFVYASSGVGFEHGPKHFNYLPPIPLAHPKIVTYVQTIADEASFRSVKVQIRIGFTTIKVDNKMYTELAEVWGFAN